MASEADIRHHPTDAFISPFFRLMESFLDAISHQRTTVRTRVGQPVNIFHGTSLLQMIFRGSTGDLEPAGTHHVMIILVFHLTN